MTDWVSSNMSTRSTKSAKTNPTKFEYNHEHSEFHHPPCQQPRTPKAHVPLRCTTPFRVRRWHDNSRVTRRYVYSCVSSPHLAKSRAACYLSFAHPVGSVYSCACVTSSHLAPSKRRTHEVLALTPQHLLLWKFLPTMVLPFTHTRHSVHSLLRLSHQYRAKRYLQAFWLFGVFRQNNPLLLCRLLPSTLSLSVPAFAVVHQQHDSAMACSWVFSVARMSSSRLQKLNECSHFLPPCVFLTS